VRIETPRSTLRPWGPKDVDQLALRLNDFEIARWLAFVPHPYGRSDAESWIARCERLAAETPPIAYEFAIEHKTGLYRIGGVSLSKIDWNNRTAGGGIWIAAPHQGLGFGREAFREKIDLAFRDLGMTSLINGYFDGNDVS
jgi:RimJ/RimL family protein N-acetyltransferase